MDNAHPSSKDTRRRAPAAYLAPCQYGTKDKVGFSEEEKTLKDALGSHEQLAVKAVKCVLHDAIYQPTLQKHFPQQCQHFDMQCVRQNYELQNSAIPSSKADSPKFTPSVVVVGRRHH